MYGYVSATKWLSEIHLTGWDDFDAYWIPRGWAKEAPIKTQSRIDTPASGERLSPGDTVVVQVKVREGDRERLQAFEGVVIAKRNRGLNSAFTVRKISSGVGVERAFQTHSPQIAKIEVKRRGDVRRAKLYYLRDRSGKSARIREKLSVRKEEAQA